MQFAFEKCLNRRFVRRIQYSAARAARFGALISESEGRRTIYVRWLKLELPVLLPIQFFLHQWFQGK